MPLPNDNYGRHVDVTTVGVKDIYSVTDGGSTIYFTLSFDTGTSQGVAYRAINGMAPAGYDSSPAYILDKNNYRGGTEIISTMSNPVTLTIPSDLTSGEAVKYSVGQNRINVYLNGQRLLLGTDYQEVGSVGSVSNQVMILQDLYASDYVEFEIK